MSIEEFLTRELKIYGLYKDEIDSIDFLSPSTPKDGSVGYIAHDYKNGERRKLKTQRYLTRKLDLRRYLSEAKIVSLSHRLNFHLWSTEELCDIKVIWGDDIVKAYKNHVGGRSCMTGDSADCTRMYADNPDIFSMLVITCGNDSLRAILVKADSGRTYVSRYYRTARFLEDVADNYIKQQGWTHGWGQDGEAGIPPEEKVSNVMYIQGGIPYMDIFQYAYRESPNHLTLLPYNNDEVEVILGATSGWLLYICPECGQGCRGLSPEGICDECLEARYEYCDLCRELTEKRHILRGPAGQPCCPDCYDLFFTECKVCGETIEARIEVGGYPVCYTCHDEYVASCSHCEEEFFKRNLVKVSGVLLCPYCYAYGTELCSECGGAELRDNIKDKERPLCKDCQEKAVVEA
ncbi:MAG: hypothetical protein JRI56_00125 [Deltaproteobacteria bacterium]|nr:hypothetical protein [Deltaproteobacteria bacterium]